MTSDGVSADAIFLPSLTPILDRNSDLLQTLTVSYHYESIWQGFLSIVEMLSTCHTKDEPKISDFKTQWWHHLKTKTKYQRHQTGCAFVPAQIRDCDNNCHLLKTKQLGEVSFQIKAPVMLNMHVEDEARKQGIGPGFETRGRRHQKSKTGVWMAPGKKLIN